MARLLKSIWAGLFDRRQREKDLADEFAAHIDMRTAALTESGLSPAAARRHARIEFGAVEAYKDACRQALVWHLVDDLRADLRYGWRTWRRSPGFVTVAVLSLALGIGVNTAVFSVMNGMLLRPLPLPQSERVYFVETGAGGNSHSFPNYRELRARARTFDGLVAYRMAAMQVEFPGGPARAWGYLATGNYFDVLRTRPALGRLFRPQDDGAPGASPYVVLSHETWRGGFGAIRTSSAEPSGSTGSRTP